MFADNEMKTLGLRIRKLREAQGWTQNVLSAKAGVSLKHLGELERGRGNPSLESLRNLAGALGLAMSELFDMGPEEKSDDCIRGEIMQRLQTVKPEILRAIHRALKP